jgi:uncharacterized protein YlxW (UPF0749 family)
MATRRRRKVVPTPPFSPYLVATLVGAVGIATLGFLLWRAWPTIVKQWKAATASATLKKDGEARSGSRASAESPAEALARLKKENESLREANSRLREQVKRTSETLAQKNAELDELKLRLLILEKTRTGPP